MSPDRNSSLNAQTGWTILRCGGVTPSQRAAATQRTTTSSHFSSMRARPALVTTTMSPRIRRPSSPDPYGSPDVVEPHDARVVGATPRSLAVRLAPLVQLRGRHVAVGFVTGDAADPTPLPTFGAPAVEVRYSGVRGCRPAAPRAVHDEVVGVTGLGVEGPVAVGLGPTPGAGRRDADPVVGGVSHSSSLRDTSPDQPPARPHSPPVKERL
jgi:hypothetical protein